MYSSRYTPACSLFVLEFSFRVKLFQSGYIQMPNIISRLIILSRYVHSRSSDTWRTHIQTVDGQRAVLRKRDNDTYNMCIRVYVGYCRKRFRSRSRLIAETRDCLVKNATEQVVSFSPIFVPSRLFVTDYIITDLSSNYLVYYVESD